MVDPKVKIKTSKKLSTSDLSLVLSGKKVLELEIKGSSKSAVNPFEVLLSSGCLLGIEKIRRSNAKMLNNKFINDITSIKNLTSKANQKILENIRRHSKKLRQAIIDDIEIKRKDKSQFDDDIEKYIELEIDKIKGFQKKLNLNLLRYDTLHYCGKCFALRPGLTLDKRQKTIVKKEPDLKCNKCDKIITKTKRIETIPAPIYSYLEGVWFEDYVWKKIESLGWTVWPQLYIYGRSGAKHEIDILAVNNQTSIIIECKTGNVSYRDVSTFISKYYDLNVDGAVFISTKDIPSDAKKLLDKNKAFQDISEVSSDKELNSKLKKV